VYYFSLILVVIHIIKYQVLLQKELHLLVMEKKILVLEMIKIFHLQQVTIYKVNSLNQEKLEESLLAKEDK